MTTETTDRFITRILKAAPIEWPAILRRFQRRNKFSTSDMNDLTHRMDDTAERLAFLSEYVTVRFGCTGCGDKNPAQAVKAAQKRQVKVAVALGFYRQYRTPFFSSGATPQE
jgi:hypothetical protein